MESRASDRTNGVIVACQQGNSEQLKYLLDNGVRSYKYKIFDYLFISVIIYVAKAFTDFD